MKIPTLTPNGLVHFGPSNFREGIEFTLTQRVDDLEEECRSSTFLAGAAALATEVFASGLDWSPVAALYLEHTGEFDAPGEEAERLLDLAWRWANYRPCSWVELCRQWIHVPKHEEYYHLQSGHFVESSDFYHLLERVLGEPSCPRIGVFNRCLAEVDRVVCDPGMSRGFHQVESAIVFNAPLTL